MRTDGGDDFRRDGGAGQFEREEFSALQFLLRRGLDQQRVPDIALHQSLDLVVMTSVGYHPRCDPGTAEFRQDQLT